VISQSESSLSRDIVSFTFELDSAPPCAGTLLASKQWKYRF